MSTTLKILVVLFSTIIASENCGTYKTPTIISVDVGVTEYIKSPNYPCDYLHDLDCAWRVYAPEGKVVAYHFASNFKTEYSANNCSMDELIIWDTALEYHRSMCGTFWDGPEGKVTTSRQMVVVFKTDGDTSHHGFKMAVTAAENQNDIGGIPARPESEVGECQERLRCYQCSGRTECDSGTVGLGNFVTCEAEAECEKIVTGGRTVSRGCRKRCLDRPTTDAWKTSAFCCSDKHGCNSGVRHFLTSTTIFIGAILAILTLDSES